MPAMNCPKHGPKMALIFCEHAGLADDERRAVPGYLQNCPSGWSTLCENCVRRSDLLQAVLDADYFICVDCALEWADVTGNAYPRRCRAAKPEFPE